MNLNKDSMENSKLLTILVEVDEGTKTPFKAHNEILSLFSAVKPSCNNLEIDLGDKNCIHCGIHISEHKKT